MAGLRPVLLVVVALFGLGVMGGPAEHGRGVADRQTRLLSLAHEGWCATPPERRAHPGAVATAAPARRTVSIC